MFAANLAIAGCEGPSPVDAEVLPPAVRTIDSPDGAYQLLIENSANGVAQAALSATGSDQLLWNQQLPHENGPRIAIVGSQGTVVLLDEWINVFTDHAITVYDRSGTVLSSVSTNEIAETMNLSRAELVAQATHGPWIAGEPFHSEGFVLVPVGERQIAIDMDDGSLDVRRP